MSPPSPSTALPEGVRLGRHRGEGTRSGRITSVVSFVILGTFLGAGLLGLLGGQPNPVTSQDFGPATLTVRAPTILRNGVFFEMELEVRADEVMSDVVIGIDSGLWRNVTINTTIPAPAEESFRDGAYMLNFGPLAAGDRLLVKIDGQINPPMFAGTHGNIALFDRDRQLGALPLSITVLP